MRIKRMSILNFFRGGILEMTKHTCGQLLLGFAAMLIVLAGASVWFNLGMRTVASVAFVIALIIGGAGAYISKKK